jgi:hypothetical protein
MAQLSFRAALRGSRWKVWSAMHIDLTNDDHALMDRYFDCVLIRHSEGVYDLDTARGELAHAFTQVARRDPAFREHMHAVLEAGDEA